ncbi:hypothetical protein [Pseudonocardia asaccharolytica]|uniref:Antitoxin n=1 Tax=Pseudonocardia asaccharolytica DSM 44247 = NBRC 16224 TaxID=1123024 RepID=A0A511D1T3_9PSEU|nr:hypothetical protein [Pseudonocardia asaccharolytica]GEL18752.1 hypothetical protein PA7_25890 [Pseudonocardia asaccharolytica DSM 44247 = NBRC 16224]
MAFTGRHEGARRRAGANVDIVEKVKELAGVAKQKATPYAEKAKQKTGPYLDTARQKATPYAEKARQRAERALGRDRATGTVPPATGAAPQDEPKNR